MNWMLRMMMILTSGLGSAMGKGIPEDCRQLVVGIANGWNDSHATLTIYDRKAGGKWRAEGASWPARLGRDGLAWGRGLHTVPRNPGAGTKREGDMRAPAGIFAIGGVWGYEANVRRHPKMPYRQVTPRDLWVEDPESPQYNRHLILPRDPETAWEKKAQMKQDEPAHALKLFIAHNAPPDVVAGAGSSIFFHIWRADGARATAGCTTMSEAKMRDLVAKIDPTKRPAYVLLPKAVYEQMRGAWGLP